MWTVQECLAKAADVERKAGLCASPEARTGLLDLAEGWRQVAGQTERNNAFKDSILFLD